MVKYSVKKGDMVKIIAGDDKGKEGKILQVLPKKAQVIVDGCNIVKKAVKPTDDNPRGGFITKEKPIHISNVKKI